MSIATYSPALALLFACALLWILMDVRFHDLSPLQKWLVPLVILLLAVFNHLLRLRIGENIYGKLILITLHVPTFLIFLRITKCGVIKMVFMILTALVFTAPVIIVGNLVRRLFPGVGWALLPANLVVYVLILLLAQFVFRKGFNYLLKYGDNRAFLLFTLVPLMYYVYIFAAQGVDLSSFTTPSGYMIRYLPTIEVFLFYFLLLYNYRTLSEKQQMETAQAALNQKLASAQKQIVLLGEANTRTAIYQHDMRHHMTMLSGFLAADHPQQAEEYIRKVQADVDAVIPRRFCENDTVNLLCSTFADRAEQQGVRMKVDVRVPHAVSISDTELCAVMSNGLENALRAAAVLQEPHKWIGVYSEVKHGKLLIEIKNPYAGEISVKNGLPITDQEGHGFGCRSIRAITENNRGLCSFEPENGVFTLRVILPMFEP